MKKITKMTAVVTSVLFFTAMTVIPVSAQSSQKASGNKKPLPSDVMNIAQNLCKMSH